MRLLRARSDAEATAGFAPLHVACVLLNETLVRLLVGYGADVQQRTPAGESCLHILVRSQAEPREPSVRGNLVGLLLMAGCDPAVLDKEGVSPLFAAVEF